MPAVRVLLLADSHLGFDWPLRPRLERRRRGADFFANFARALEPARRGEVDLVVHGGDVLYRSRVRRELVHRAFAPLVEVAASGVPVVVVAGNHERSAIPFPLLAAHPDLHLVDHPRTVLLDIRGTAVAVTGFPHQRGDVARLFRGLLAAAGTAARADLRLLCLHQAVEGARVGPAGYTFRRGPEVIAGRDLPTGFAAVLAGHIHRHQVLTADLAGRPLAAPVLYPGSIERTSAAERHEPKGFLTLTLSPGCDGGRLDRWTFHELPTRPWVTLDLHLEGLGREQLAARLASLLARLDPDAVVDLRVLGSPTAEARELLGAARLRSLAPASMTLNLLRGRS